MRNRNQRFVCRHEGVALRQAAEHLDQGEETLALETLALLLEEEPDHLAALEIRAKALMRLGEVEPALHCVERLLRLNPFELGYVFMRGQLYQAQGTFTLAEADFDRCAGSEGPEREPATLALADLRHIMPSRVKPAVTSRPVDSVAVRASRPS